ncbi:MAG: phosphomannomutase [Epsilonproteobacteria bacterium (ex Lamellibrachia satsuma)]|nr:MAG: phosphomannomutase [Epsilonproteobacteria bacterium (ex Lamellibrachia satsuma)]
MIITIQEKQFDTAKITQLYPAAVVKTGFEDETTQVSLEWLDVEAKDKVEVVGFGIFVHLGEEDKHTFMFDTKKEMDEEIGRIASQLNR